jgi:hypothetical protein
MVSAERTRRRLEITQSIAARADTAKIPRMAPAMVAGFLLVGEVLVEGEVAPKVGAAPMPAVFLPSDPCPDTLLLCTGSAPAVLWLWDPGADALGPPPDTGSGPFRATPASSAPIARVWFSGAYVADGGPVHAPLYMLFPFEVARSTTALN